MLASEEAGADAGLAEKFETFRHHLVDRVFLAAGVLAVLYLPMLLWRAREVGWQSQLIVHALFVLLALVLLPLRARLGLIVKSGLLVAVFLCLGVLGIFTMGMMGTGYWWCLQAAVLAATLFSMRAGVVMAGGCAVLMLIVGLGFASGRLAAPMDLNLHITSSSAWAAFLVVVLFAPIALLLALGGYQNMIEGLVGEIDVQRRQLAGLVGYDQLTGLPLVNMAIDRLEMALKQATRAGHMAALLFIDLDGFKAINDTHGHSAGDHLLKEMAGRLIEAVRAEDTVARVGGDEFIVILGHLTDWAAAGNVADKIIAQANRPFDWQGRSLTVGASIGVAVFPQHGADAESLRRLADAAMYDVKRRGRNGYGFAHE